MPYTCLKCNSIEYNPGKRYPYGYPFNEWCNLCFGNRNLNKPMEIIGVAIKHNDLVICLPKPNRHQNVVKYMIDVLGFSQEAVEQGVQGFYTAAGEFLDRKQAMKRVLEIKQPMKEELQSDDIW